MMCTYMHRGNVYTVHVKKDATNVPQWHRLARCTVRRAPCAALSLLCAPYFDAILESVPSCKAPQFLDCGAFPVKMWHLLPNCGTFGKKHRNTIFHTRRTNPEANNKSVARFLIKTWHKNVTNCCILFDVYRTKFGGIKKC